MNIIRLLWLQDDSYSDEFDEDSEDEEDVSSIIIEYPKVGGGVLTP